MLTILLPIVASLAKSLAGQFITDGEFLKWFTLAVNVVDAGVDVEGKLQDLESSIAARLEKGEHFKEADFDAVVARIAARDERWANL